MSSEGSNSSDEEGGDAYDLLAKIQKQLNQEHHDDEEDEEEESETVLASDQNKNEIRDATGNKDEPNSEQSSAQSDDAKKEGIFIGEAANPVAQQNQNGIEVSSGINNNTILEQKQIPSNEHGSSSETASYSINTQISVVNTEKQSPTSQALSQQQQQSLSPSKNPIAFQSTQPQEQILADKQNEIPVNPLAPTSAVVTVRNEAIRKEEAQDNIIAALERITLTRNLLEDEEILGHRIDSYALEQTLESVRRRFDENMLRFSSKQKAIFDRIRDIARRSTLVAEQTNSSGKIFAKKKQADKEKHVKDVQRLSNDAAKTKTFLLMMITRLEAIEHDVDKLTDTQMKKTALAESKALREKIGVQEVLENKNNADSQVVEEEEKQQK